MSDLTTIDPGYGYELVREHGHDTEYYSARRGGWFPCEVPDEPEFISTGDTWGDDPHRRKIDPGEGYEIVPENELDTVPADCEWDFWNYLLAVWQPLWNYNKWTGAVWLKELRMHAFRRRLAPAPEPPPPPQWPPWTPVNTPPTEPGYYLAQLKGGEIWKAHYNDKFWSVGNVIAYLTTSPILTDDIVAWMSYPPPYVPPPPDPKEEALAEWNRHITDKWTDLGDAFRAGWDAKASQ